MTYLQTPPDASPPVSQATAGLQSWKRTGRRLVQIGGRLPTANQLHQSSVKILSKHLASNKKGELCVSAEVEHNADSESKPTEIVETFTFVGYCETGWRQRGDERPPFCDYMAHFPSIVVTSADKTAEPCATPW